MLAFSLLLFAAETRAGDYPRYPARGSTYVPVDSWVYPALERLAAWRYINSDFRGMRPWTRTECARLSDEAGENIRERIRTDQEVLSEAADLQQELAREFAEELRWLGGEKARELAVESLYSRVLSMSGPILNDSYHFGQTISNDYGRPARRGTNAIAGGNARASYGPFFGYVWGEYQHSPAMPSPTQAILDLQAQQDQIFPAKTATGIPFEPINRFRLLDTYAGVNLWNWQISYGRQSLWWGTSESGPLLMSNNAEPINMLRINRVVPFRLPWIFKYLGPMRIDAFVGRLGGHEIAAHPWLQGQRISFKMTRWFEFALTHTATFCGAGQECGVDVFFKALIPINELRTISGTAKSLSDQHMSFDFQLRAKKLFTWYGEFLGSDDPHPFNAPTRMAVNTGLYFSRLPGLSRMDLRVEGYYTDTPNRVKDGFMHSLHYSHSTYKNGYTNNGNILGNAVGRSGIGYHAWLGYWLSPRQRIVLGFNHTGVSTIFMPGGGQWSDFSARYEGKIHGDWWLRSWVQIETMKYPVLFSVPQTNTAAAIEIRFVPEQWQIGRQRN